MPHGAPDNYQVRPKNTVYSLDDDAELAVRLGSIDKLNRLGDVIFIDNFANGIEQFESNISGTGGVIVSTGDRFNSDGFSAKFTAGSDGAHRAELIKYIPYSVVSRFGFEVSYARGDEAEAVELDMYVYFGSSRVWGTIRHDLVNSTLFYRDENEDFQVIDNDYAAYDKDKMFNTIKVVIDFENRNYVRLITNRESYDLTAYALNYEVNYTGSHIRFILRGIGTSGNNGIIYFDDVIVTQNEP